MSLVHFSRAFKGVIWREMLRFWQQRERFFAALVRPLIWLFVFAVGFRAALGLPPQAPYDTYIPYELYIVPGLIAMIQLFSGMQSSLSMVYDREMGSMRVLLTTPLPRWFLLLSRLFAGTVVSVIQVYAFLFIAALCSWITQGVLGSFLGIVDCQLQPEDAIWPVRAVSNFLCDIVTGSATPLELVFHWFAYIAVLPAIILSGMMLGALGMLLSSTIKQLENFAGIMNFVIFPMFFASSALYPLWRVKESSIWLHNICVINPFTYAVELVRHALHLSVNWWAIGVVFAVMVLFLGFAIYAYDPAKGIQARKAGAGGS